MRVAPSAEFVIAWIKYSVEEAVVSEAHHALVLFRGPVRGEDSVDDVLQTLVRVSEPRVYDDLA